MPFEHDSLPIRLFTASHKRAWNPGDIDFAQERSDWLALTDDERRVLLRLVSAQWRLLGMSGNQGDKAASESTRRAWPFNEIGWAGKFLSRRA